MYASTPEWHWAMRDLMDKTWWIVCRQAVGLVLIVIGVASLLCVATHPDVLCMGWQLIAFVLFLTILIVGTCIPIVGGWCCAWVEKCAIREWKHGPDSIPALWRLERKLMPIGSAILALLLPVILVAIGITSAKG